MPLWPCLWKIPDGDVDSLGGICPQCHSLLPPLTPNCMEKHTFGLEVQAGARQKIRSIPHRARWLGRVPGAGPGQLTPLWGRLDRHLAQTPPGPGGRLGGSFLKATP